ncbi:MAG: hypothetical protein RBT75_14800 [Anaerolineae bacterium]|nr:hypothetical protein [Anaerolineae bacterium]
MKITIPENKKKPQDGEISAAATEAALAAALTAYTDALLEGQTPETAPELGATVRQLAQALPHTTPPAGLQQRVLRQVRLTWSEAPALLGSRLAAAWRDLKRSLTRNPTWAAMAALVIVGTLVALLAQGSTEVAGTVTGISPVGWISILAAGALLAGAALWWRKRR